MAGSVDVAATEGKNWVDRVDPELKEVARQLPDMTISSRWKAALMNTLMCLPSPTPQGVKAMKVKGIGTLFLPSDETNAAPTTSASAILWMHSGGRIVGSANAVTEKILCSIIVNRFGLPVLSVEYRLAPSHPFPAALDDAHKAYTWLVSHLDSTTVTGKMKSEVKIAVAGESAGAGLAAELCQRLLDESQDQEVPVPVCQLLFYPMLDDRTCTDTALSKLPLHLVWNNKSNMYGWSSYLGPKHKPGDESLPKYASASRREDLTNLPPAIIQVGDLDLFWNECKDYAKRLEAVGVETVFVEIKGMFHGAMTIGGMRDVRPVVKAWERFEAFGKKFLFD